MKTTKIRIAVMLTASLLALASCGGGDSGSAGDAATEAGTSNGAPTFTTKTIDGKKFSSASFEGKPTVLWFWAPWCTVCRGEAPTVDKAATKMKSKVDFIGVAGRGKVDEMKQFVSQTRTGNFTHVVDDDGSIWSAYGVAAQPAFAFIDADGKVSMTMGTLDYDDLIDRVQQLAK